MKYREKVHIIDAVQWNGNNKEEIVAATGKSAQELFYYEQLQVENLGNRVVVEPGTYVARMDNGQICLYSKEYLKNYYEPMDEAEEKIEISTPPRAGKHSRVESMFGPRENWDPGAKREEKEPQPKEDITMEDAVKSLDKPKPQKGYSGFLFLRCDSCGNTRGMCVKRPLKEYRCSCGHETKLKGLKKVEFTCSCCGTAFTYQTNMTSLGFTMECLSCKSPVDLMYSQKERKYKGGENA